MERHESYNRWGDINSVNASNTLVIRLYRPRDTNSPYTVLTIDALTDVPASVDMDTIVNSDTAINSGDYFKVAAGTGSPDWDSISITIVYKPTNTNLGTWTIYS